MSREQLNKSHQASQTQDVVTFMVHKEVKKHLEAGKKCFDLGDVPGALEHYKAALAIDPDCALVHFNLGFAYYESQDRETAKRCYQRAIELEGNCSLFLEHLAKLHFECEEYTQAIALFQRAHLVGQIQPVSFGLWGRCYYELEDYESAAEQLQKMLRQELTPTLAAYARYYLVLSWLRAGNLFRVRRDIEPLLQTTPTESELLADLGEQLLEAKCITLAKRCLERYVNDRQEVNLSRSYEEIVEIEQRVDLILPRLFSGDEERILQNIHLLFQFGSEKVARALASIQDARSPLIREAVIEYHRRYGYPFGGNIERLLSDTTAFVREKAAQYIYQSEERKYEPLMLALLEDPSPRVRRFAVLYLRDTAEMDAMPRLSRLLEQEDDPENQRLLRLALGAVKMRSERRQRALIATHLPQETPGQLLEPLSPRGASSVSSTDRVWYLLLAAGLLLAILALLSL